jgi:flagellar basal-body rod protein FlgF
MPYGLYISAEGAQAQDRRLQVIANNLANVDTVGFKRDLATFQARYAEAIQQGLQSPGSGALEDLGGGVLLRQTKTDFSSGPLRHTEIPTDMAIEGEGFFVVEKGGQRLLTRAGNFRLTPSGALVTQQGDAVLTDSGSPVSILPDGGRWQVTPSGAVQQGGAQQPLAIVKPAAPNDLVKVGENLFQPQTDPVPVAAGERRVASGYVELSSVRPTTEMVQLIEASRLMEANLNLLKAQDQMLSGLVNRVLKA